MSRTEFSRTVKAAAALRANGHCEGCTARLRSGGFHFDHIIPDGIGGPATLENCQVLCKTCHDTKTRKADVPRVAQMKRQRDRNTGALRTTRGFKGWRRFSGEIVWARDGSR
jgi:5-methylcytosine-specific restriction protein A